MGGTASTSSIRHEFLAGDSGVCVRVSDTEHDRPRSDGHLQLLILVVGRVREMGYADDLGDGDRFSLHPVVAGVWPIFGVVLMDGTQDHDCTPANIGQRG